MDINITIFTPTYNRAYILERLYRSLQRQTNKSFEWLVVDDGSVDNTAALFSKWAQEENGFCIRYYKKQNGGKHRAVNLGLDLAKGNYFMVVDSDDWLTRDAVEKLCVWTEDIKNDNLVVGIVANKGTSNEETPNYFFKQSFLDKTLLDMKKYEENGKKVLSGERAMCFRTEIHKRYKYPEFDGEKFVTEAVAYNRMANDGLKMRFFNDIITIYEYQEDGLSSLSGELYLRNPRGYGLWVGEKAKFDNLSVIQYVKILYAFYCDLSERYTVNFIAKCIGTNFMVIWAMMVVHKIAHCMKKGLFFVN